jgi:hypothetical protein
MKQGLKPPSKVGFLREWRSQNVTGCHPPKNRKALGIKNLAKVGRE